MGYSNIQASLVCAWCPLTWTKQYKSKLLKLKEKIPVLLESHIYSKNFPIHF